MVSVKQLIKLNDSRIYRLVFFILKSKDIRNSRNKGQVISVNIKFGVAGIFKIRIDIKWISRTKGIVQIEFP